VPYQINNISFFYGNKKIIDDFSLTIDPGKFYGIIGPNGSGKTTIIDLLMGHKKSASGKIKFMGKNLSEYSKKELSVNVSLVPQDYYINFPFTTEEVVMMGRYPHIPRFNPPSGKDRGLVHATMKKTGVDEFNTRYITELSGGERQRVVFARAIAQDTPLLLLDEATSNLDISHSISMLNIAAQGVRQKNKTVIAVFQDINLAALFCENLLFLNHGRIAAYGKTEQVLNEKTIKDVFNIQAKVYLENYSDSKQVVFRK